VTVVAMRAERAADRLSRPPLPRWPTWWTRSQSTSSSNATSRRTRSGLRRRPAQPGRARVRLSHVHGVAISTSAYSDPGWRSGTPSGTADHPGPRASAARAFTAWAHRRADPADAGVTLTSPRPQRRLRRCCEPTRRPRSSTRPGRRTTRRACATGPAGAALRHGSRSARSAGSMSMIWTGSAYRARVREGRKERVVPIAYRRSRRWTPGSGWAGRPGWPRTVAGVAPGRRGGAWTADGRRVVHAALAEIDGVPDLVRTGCGTVPRPISWKAVPT